jgi:translation initiation factor IF-3
VRFGSNISHTPASADVILAGAGFPSARRCCFHGASHRLRCGPHTNRRTQLDQELAIAGNQEPRINDRIRAREVRLVGADGEQIGIKPLPEALVAARQLGLDLVEVADKANPPVCRIMDYGKYKYEAAQRAKDSRKKSTNIVVKEMKYRPKIGRGDFDTKTRKVKGFLEDGHKVKLTIMFRGREVQHPELGRKILDDVAEVVGSIAKVEAYPRLDGRNMTMVLGPDKQAIEALKKVRAQEQEREEAEAARAEASIE